MLTTCVDYGHYDEDNATLKYMINQKVNKCDDLKIVYIIGHKIFQFLYQIGLYLVGDEYMALFMK